MQSALSPISVKSQMTSKRKNDTAVRSSGSSRARARGGIPPLETRAERVAYLLELMLDGLFNWGTARAVARAWNVNPETARDYTAEARRHYMREVDRAGRGDHKARIFALLEFIGRDALERREEVVDAMGDIHSLHKPDHRTARQCVVDLAQLAGHLVHRHEVNVTELSDDDIRAQLRAHGLEVIETTAEPAALGQGEKHGRDPGAGAGQGAADPAAKKPA
jgi:hypothetical protein